MDRRGTLTYTRAVDVVTEHVDVEAADGVADALFAHPAEGVHPAVLVYMDAYGIRPSL